MSDITNHKWHDDDFLNAHEDGEFLIIDMPCGGGHVALNKDDAIAIAKHFGIYQQSDKERLVANAMQAVMWKSRRLHMYAMRKNGATYQSIGDNFGVSLGRARTICKKEREMEAYLLSRAKLAEQKSKGD